MTYGPFIGKDFQAPGRWQASRLKPAHKAAKGGTGRTKGCRGCLRCAPGLPEIARPVKQRRRPAAGRERGRSALYGPWMALSFVWSSDAGQRSAGWRARVLLPLALRRRPRAGATDERARPSAQRPAIRPAGRPATLWTRSAAGLGHFARHPCRPRPDGTAARCPGDPAAPATAHPADTRCAGGRPYPGAAPRVRRWRC